MRTKLLSIIAISCFWAQNYAQTIHIDYIHDVENVPTATPLKNAVDLSVSKDEEKMQSFKIISKDLPAKHILKITIAGKTEKYDSPNKEALLDFKKEIINQEVTIQHFNDQGAEVPGDLIKFRFIPETKAPKPPIDPKKSSIRYCDD